MVGEIEGYLFLETARLEYYRTEITFGVVGTDNNECMRIRIHF